MEIGGVPGPGARGPGSIPLMAEATDPGEDEAGGEVEGEDGDREGGVGDDGGGDGEVEGDEVVGGAHGGELAGPGPVGGDKGLDEFLQGSGEGEDRAGQGELEADEIDAEEGGLLGGTEEGADRKADGGHGAIDEEEEEGAVRQGAGEVGEVVYKKGHPEGLGTDEDAEEEGFAEQIGGGTEAGEAFLFIDEALARDFAGGVVGAHEGEEDDLEHHQTGDEAAEAGLAFDGARLNVDGLEDGEVAVTSGLGHRADAIVGEEDDKKREAQQEGKVEEELGAVAQEKGEAAGEEDTELTEEGGELGRIMIYGGRWMMRDVIRQDGGGQEGVGGGVGGRVG